VKRRKKSINKEVQNWLDNGMYQVRDEEHLRQLVTKGENTSEEVYEILIRIIARVGALWMPLREHPEVKQIMTEESDGKSRS